MRVEYESMYIYRLYGWAEVADVSAAWRRIDVN